MKNADGKYNDSISTRDNVGMNVIKIAVREGDK
jgi:hypothetical protein